MRPRTGQLAGVVLLWLLVGNAATAQTTRPTTLTQPDDRLDRLEKRLDEMDRQHRSELQARDEEIARLRATLQQREPPATRPATAPDAIRRNTDDILGELQTSPTKSPATTAVDRAIQDAARDAEVQSRSSASTRNPVSFNPDFAVISDFVGSYSTDRANPARNRFDVREIELDLRAAVDPRADAVAILPVARDVDDPLFFRDSSDSSGEVNTGIEVEEAYLFLHDFGVPNLTAKLGRFHLRFGRWDILHKHDWVTSDNTFVNQSFLGSESLVDQGLSLSYVVPPSLIGGQYVEVVGEVISGEGDSENPVLNNDTFVHSPALNMHALWNHDFGQWNVELGGSWLTGHHNADNHQYFNLFGTDLTLIRTDPTGRFNNQLIQFEAIYGNTDISRSDASYAFGAFLVLQQQLTRDFYTGVRLDWTKDAVDDTREVWGVSPYLTWYWSEFLRFRVEYQHKAGDVKTEDTVFFQVTWIFGAHPPHPYWAVK